MIFDALLLAALAGVQGKHGEFPSETLVVGDAVREYRLVVPKTVALDQPAPLVLAFHGMLVDSKDLMPAYTKLNETAEKHRFLVAYPNAAGKAWGLAPAQVGRDLAFVDALLAKLRGDFKIDPDRLYVLGMSNGGYFAHLVAKERSRTVAAAACHSGALGLQTLGGVHAERKFPVLIVHGDQDRVIPVEFARENRDKYAKEGHEVSYVELAGVGHVWGAKAGVNETIWKFFADRPRERK
jgi:polyhydroxybutyrate depolymerase